MLVGVVRSDDLEIMSPVGAGGLGYIHSLATFAVHVRPMAIACE